MRFLFSDKYLDSKFYLHFRETKIAKPKDHACFKTVNFSSQNLESIKILRTE